ncbi:Cysteine protease atg4 [Spiromyces aspiralis]|uniref:Cysteine protease atg4 n=1 Tax=Spiromyces aspiralis TaxID=68401 RepID=A0ACC1HX92_9FUNG|nr:Cysteine protease atg4 [Spiromyces aspiralis]
MAVKLKRRSTQSDTTTTSSTTAASAAAANSAQTQRRAIPFDPTGSSDLPPSCATPAATASPSSSAKGNGTSGTVSTSSDADSSTLGTDLGNIRFKVINTLRQWYMSTTYSMNALLSGKLLKPPSGQIWLLGVEYSRKVLAEDSPTAPSAADGGSLVCADLQQPPSSDALLLRLPQSSLVSQQQQQQQPTGTVPSQAQGGLSALRAPSYPEAFLCDFQSLIWCTYRARYPPISPTEFTTDAGWGCMLRAGQSLLGQALLMHTFGCRDWRVDRNNPKQVQTYTRIMEQFVDDSDPQSSFSIHHMASLGRQYGKDIGEWFGPNATAQIIKQLAVRSNQDFYIYTTIDSTVYVLDILDSNESFDVVDLQSSGEGERHHPARKSTASSSGGGARKQSIDTSAFASCAIQPTLILASTRLGIDHVNPVYYPFIEACLTFPQSVGIAGGKPSSALYFVGYEDSDLIYLDPHYTRPAIPSKPKGKFTMDDFASYHCDTPRKIALSRIDPCMVFGFYCRDSTALLDLCERFDALASSGIQCGFTMNWSHSPAVMDDMRVLDDLAGMSMDSEGEEDNDGGGDAEMDQGLKSVESLEGDSVEEAEEDRVKTEDVGGPQCVRDRDRDDDDDGEIVTSDVELVENPSRHYRHFQRPSPDPGQGGHSSRFGSPGRLEKLSTASHDWSPQATRLMNTTAGVGMERAHGRLQLATRGQSASASPVPQPSGSPVRPLPYTPNRAATATATAFGIPSPHSSPGPVVTEGRHSEPRKRSDSLTSQTYVNITHFDANIAAAVAPPSVATASPSRSPITPTRQQRSIPLKTRLQSSRSKFRLSTPSKVKHRQRSPKYSRATNEGNKDSDAQAPQSPSSPSSSRSQRGSDEWINL